VAVANERSKQAEGRNAMLWGLVATLAVGLVGSVATHIF
jgi:hypothetical protein